MFTEHGGSHQHDGRPAAWRGVALYRVQDGRLAENWTQEDYFARGRQLATGSADIVPAPAPAPWTTAPQPANTDALALRRDWLARPDLGVVTIDDGSPAVIEPHTVDIARIFAAGERVAFAARWTGTYAGGFDDVDPIDDHVSIGVCGVLDVSNGSVVGGRIVTDRLGLRRSMLGH